MQKQKVCSRANIANIGKEREIIKREVVFMFFYVLSPLFNVRKTLRTFREHCESEQGVPVSAFLQLDGLDQLRLDERIDYAPQGICIDVHVPEKDAMPQAAAVVPQIAEGFLPEGVELVVVDEYGGLVEHAHDEVADGAPCPVERGYANLPMR